MNADMIRRARLAVASPRWRWMPGMLHGTLVGDELEGDIFAAWVDDHRIRVQVTG